MRRSTGGYIPGQPYGECDRCGFQYRLHELRTEWTNLKVCDKCWDPRPVHLNTPNLTAGEGAPLPGARPTIVHQTDSVLWSDGSVMEWSDVDRLYNDPVLWTDTGG